MAVKHETNNPEQIQPVIPGIEEPAPIVKVPEGVIPEVEPSVPAPEPLSAQPKSPGISDDERQKYEKELDRLGDMGSFSPEEARSRAAQRAGISLAALAEEEFAMNEDVPLAELAKSDPMLDPDEDEKKWGNHDETPKPPSKKSDLPKQGSEQSPGTVRPRTKEQLAQADRYDAYSRDRLHPRNMTNADYEALDKARELAGE